MASKAIGKIQDVALNIAVWYNFDCVPSNAPRCDTGGYQAGGEE